ncbi:MULTISPECIES: hypothetical protein [Clostridia]|uniref:hypothetical protein n=1 Tax=Clostridia TaxID=186801 RepID=UPI001314BC45|nr:MULTISPECIES: hypothetical protein [Clostridia]
MSVIVPNQRKLQPEDVRHLANTGIKAIMIGAVVTGDEVESLEWAISEFKKAMKQLR